MGNKEVELQDRSKKDRHQNLENRSTLKHEQKSMKKHEEEKGESSSPDAADSTDDCRKDKRRHNTGPNAYQDGTPAQDKTTGSEALESVQPLVKPDKRLDKDYERKRKERNLELEKGWRRGKYSDSRQDVEREHKEKPSKGAGRVDTDRYKNPGGSKDSDSRSEKNRKRKGENTDRHYVKAQSSKCLKTKIAEDPKTCKSESPNPFDRKKQKTEKKREGKTWPLTESDIWEGGIKVKPQKKISININLDGKKKEEKTEKWDLGPGKTKEKIEKTVNGEEEKLNRGETEVNEKKESSRDQEGVSEGKIKPEEGEARLIWEKATFRDDNREMWKKIAGEKKDVREEKEDREEEDVDLWHCALRGLEEEKKEGKKQLEEGDRMEASKEQEVTNSERRSVRGGKEEGRRVRSDSRGQEMGELVAGAQKERTAGETTCKENRGNPKSKEELMEGVKWKMRTKRTEDATRSKSQGSRNKIHCDGPNTTVDEGRSEFLRFIL